MVESEFVRVMLGYITYRLYSSKFGGAPRYPFISVPTVSLDSLNPRIPVMQKAGPSYDPEDPRRMLPPVTDQIMKNVLSWHPFVVGRKCILGYPKASALYSNCISVARGALYSTCTTSTDS